MLPFVQVGIFPHLVLGQPSESCERSPDVEKHRSAVGIKILDSNLVAQAYKQTYLISVDYKSEFTRIRSFVLHFEPGPCIKSNSRARHCMYECWEGKIMVHETVN